MDKSYWFVFFRDNLLLLPSTEGHYTVPCQEEPPVPLTEWNTVRTYTEMKGLALQGGTGRSSASCRFKI